jgi:hypothetical protein
MIRAPGDEVDRWNGDYRPWVSGSTQRHLGWTRDFRTALGCRPDFLAPFFAADLFEVLKERCAEPLLP